MTVKMSEIAEKLCYYDTRNPDGVKSYMTEEEIKELGYTATSKQDCSCDNCFYGRTKLAIAAIEVIDTLPTWDDVEKAIKMARAQYWDVDNRGFYTHTDGDWSFKHSEEEIIEHLKQSKK